MDELIKYLRSQLKNQFWIVRRTLDNRIAIKMPNANQEESERILKFLFSLCKDNYCFLCFDPEHIRAGEIGLELSPGCNWSEVYEIVLQKESFNNG